MKRLGIFLVLLNLFVLAGCSLFSSSKDDDDVTTTVNVTAAGDVYLVKLNNSNKTVKAKDTGYVSSTKPRSAVNDEGYNDTDRFIRDLNQNINTKVSNYLSSADRSAGILSSVENGYSDKGQETFFWSYTSTKTKTTLLSGTYEVNVATKVTSELKKEGRHCYIYADTNNSNAANKGISLSDSDYIALANKFDACYEKETAVIGNPVYDSYNSSYFVPCNPKIVILVSDLFGDANKDQESGTVGYFYSGDLYNQYFLDNTAGLNKYKNSTDDDYIHSNGCEMFYIDALFLSKLPDTVYSTLVHEFNHMINYVVKTLNYMTNKTSINSLRACDVWFTEMLAMTTEDMFQSYLGINDEHSPKGRLPYFGMYYYCGFKNWDDKNVEPLVMYANTYAFGAFLARNFGGVKLIKEIAQNDFVNELAITKALQTLYPDFTYVDELTKETKKIDYTFALRKFTMCIINTEPDTGYTLNNGTTFSDDLGFTPINISGTINYQGKQYQIPFTFRSDKQGQIDIYPTGFTVHYVGRNLKNFKVTVTNAKDLEYYVIQ